VQTERGRGGRHGRGVGGLDELLECAVDEFVEVRGTSVRTLM